MNKYCIEYNIFQNGDCIETKLIPGFKTQKACREELVSNGYNPIFKRTKRCTIYNKEHDNIREQATIREENNDMWIGFEGKIQKSLKHE